MRGDYDGALAQYRKSFEIDEELGNRTGIATSYSQLGILLAAKGNPAEGLAYDLRALALHGALRVPDVDIDLHWIGRHRASLGEIEFQRSLREHVGDDVAEQIIAALERRTTQ